MATISEANEMRVQKCSLRTEVVYAINDHRALFVICLQRSGTIVE